jgi:hypothetical protein
VAGTAPEDYGELYADAWIGRAELLFDGYAENAPKDSKLLMHGGGFQYSKFRDPFPPTNLLTVLEPIAKVDLDLNSVNLSHFQRTEHRSQAFERILVRLVRSDSANRRLELRAEGLQLRFQEPDVATHYAEMGNLLSLQPKDTPFAG